MESKVKVLVAGDVRGCFKQLFNRVENVNKKAGPFEVLLCVGDFFGSDAQNEALIAYKNGCKHIPVPTFILGPNSKELAKNYAELKDGEVCTNLTYLGKRGLYTLSSGVRIAYLSGREAAHSDECSFNMEDVAAVRNSCLVSQIATCEYKGIDILITSQWPMGVLEQGANVSKLVAYLCREVKPRYHFSAMNGRHYDLAPFRMPVDDITQLDLSTRFIAMADVGNTNKEKYIYALSVTPVEKMRIVELLMKTTDETECPFVGMDFADCRVKGEQAEVTQFFFDTQGRDGHKRLNGSQQQPQQKRTKFIHIDQEKCWFCLSSPDVEKHLVISIGENFYLALAKGPINEHHVLILSVTHIANAALLSDDHFAELLKYKAALRDFFKEQGQVVCFTERHYKSSHLQINALGIDAGYAWKIRHAFEDKAEEFNLQFETIPALTSADMLPQKCPYFVTELPDKTTMVTRQMKGFPLHFARDVFCSENLLNCDEKVDWHQCKLDKDQQIAMVTAFRKKFNKFDFTL